MTTRQEIVDEARTWLDTPYRHQGRVKGVGVDCGGYLECIVEHFDLLPDYTANPIRADYGRLPDGGLERVLDKHLLIIPKNERQMADIVLMGWAVLPSHLAIFTSPDFVIHSFAPRKKVLEMRFEGYLERASKKYYRFPGID